METELCKLANKYKNDKGPVYGRHNYTPIYYEMFKDKRESVKKVLELGIGYRTTKNMKFGYDRGSSLYMWRDFFPNAQIYGADIVPDIMFEEDHIKTFVCDERKEEDLLKLIEQTGSDIDLFVDDGSHRTEDQALTLKILRPIMRDAIYIIEDVSHFRNLRKRMPRYEYEFLSPQLVLVKYRQ